MPRGEIVAAASRYTTGRLRAKPTDQSWQGRAWDMYDSTPEVRFAARWIANAMSGAVLYAGRRNEDGKIEPLPPEHRASELVAGIAGGADGQGQFLAAFGPHLMVPGEAWVVIRPTVRNGVVTGESWHVLSIRELTPQGSKMIAEIDGLQVEVPAYDETTPPDPTVPAAIRVWEPHPARHIEADSPVRASLQLLEELQLLNAAVAAIARSRLTGRGILLIPKGTRFPSSPVPGGGEDDLIDVFMTVAETAYRDPESTAATVPIVLEVPAEAIGDIRRLTFESDFDDLAIRLREEAIRRFATGLDVPAEILLGMGALNHWGVWQLSQEAISLGVRPRLDTVTHALTTQWLRPLLEGTPDADECLVAADTSPLRVRGNRSQTALEVYDRGGISARALRRETGFDESDAPEADEAPVEEPGEEGPAAPGLPVDEAPREPDTLPAAASPRVRVREGLVAAADGLIWAALTTAGRRLVNSPVVPRSERARWSGTDPAELYALLPVGPEQIKQHRLVEGAWRRVPEIAARYDTDPECLTASLDEYVQGLLIAGIAHDYDLLPTVVASCWEQGA